MHKIESIVSFNSVLTTTCCQYIRSEQRTSICQMLWTIGHFSIEISFHWQCSDCQLINWSCGKVKLIPQSSRAVPGDCLKLSGNIWSDWSSEPPVQSPALPLSELPLVLAPGPALVLVLARASSRCRSPPVCHRPQCLLHCWLTGDDRKPRAESFMI